MAQIWHSPSVSDIETQKLWELEGVERGVRRARAEIDGQRVGDSKLGSALMQRVVPALITQIKAAQQEATKSLARQQRGPSHPWWYIILMLPADKLAVITMKNVLSPHPRDFTLNPAVTSLANEISRSLLDQLEYEDWRGDDKKTVDRFFKNYQLTPRNLKRLRERMEKRREDRWDKPTGIQVGVVLLTCLTEAVPEWFQIAHARLRSGRFEQQLVITDEAREALFKISEQCELSQPHLMPTVVPPADWRIAA